MKKSFGLIIGSTLLLASCAALPDGSGIVTIYNKPTNAPQVITLSNQFLTLDFLTETAEIVVTQNSTGNIWRSTPEGASDILDSTFINLMHMQSLFLLEFENQQGTNITFDAYRRSIQGSTFVFDKVDDGLNVRFAIGDIPEIFVMPIAVPESRMRYFTDQMTVMQRMFVSEVFRLIDPDRLGLADDLNELLERYPTLVYENVYSMNSNVQTHMLQRVEGYFANVGYTMEDFYHDLGWFELDDVLDSPIFNLTIRFELDENNLVVSIPFDEIVRPEGLFPTAFTLMPFFGAGNPAYHQGYVFVPDGSGALIHFDSTRNNQQIYNNNVWGFDAAVYREIVVHNNVAFYPVFGSYKNGQTFLGIIEQGASYAAIVSELSGMSGPYTTVHPRFRLLQGASLNVGGRSDRPFYIHERMLPQGESIVVRYVFPTEQQGYVGMAFSYREFLQARYPWLNERLQSPVNAAVEILGAAEITQHILGFPVDRPLPLTTYQQAADIINDLYNMGWRGVPIKMRGAHNNSIDHSVPNRVRLISQLGGRNGFNSMLNAANNSGFDFYLEGDFVHMRDITMFDGFNPTRDASRFVSRERVEGRGHSPTHFVEQHVQDMFADPTTLARPQVTVNLVNSFVSSASDFGVNNIAFRTLASSLGGDFHEQRHISREAAMNMRQDLLQDLYNTGTNIWLNGGFSYAIPFASMITNMPLTDQNFGITDTVVPFYQIALHGFVNFAGSPLNLADDYSYELLRSIESGASLFFSFMYEPTSAIMDTRYRRYFANEYRRWSNVANELYQNHRNNFGHLYNQIIVDHQLLANGVSVTIYEDGTRVYVNTSLTDFSNGNVNVPARRYHVVRG